jgi:hypothetical protein
MNIATQARRQPMLRQQQPHKGGQTNSTTQLLQQMRDSLSSDVPSKQPQQHNR